MRAILFIALLAVLLPLSSAAQGLGPPRPQRLEGNAELTRLLVEGREVSVSGLDDGSKPPFYLARLYGLPEPRSCPRPHRGVCGFRYYLAVRFGSAGGSAYSHLVFDLGVLGEITRAEYRGEPLVLRITVVNLPGRHFEAEPRPARQEAVYDIILGSTLEVVPVR